MPAIELAGVTKTFHRHRGVTDIDLAVEEGEIFGYLGPNGAGKTTTIRMLLDLLRPNKGVVKVFGRAPSETNLRAQIGYLPGDLRLYEDLTGVELLTHLDHLRGGGSLPRARAIAERLKVDLSRRIQQLSKGNKQKIGVVQAFMHRPRLLILDEPSSGLDPLMQQEFFAMVTEAQRGGATIFLSSHVLSEVDRTAGRVGIIREGRLVDVAPIEELKLRALRHFEIIFDGPAPIELFAAIPGVSDLTADGLSLNGRIHGSADALVKAVATLPITSFVCEDADLEALFLAYYRSHDVE